MRNTISQEAILEISRRYGAVYDEPQNQMTMPKEVFNQSQAPDGIVVTLMMAGWYNITASIIEESGDKVVVQLG